LNANILVNSFVGPSKVYWRINRWCDLLQHGI